MGKVVRFFIFAEKICDMTISFILKRSKVGFAMDDAEGGATIYVRLRDGRSLDSTSSTGYAVNPLWWDAKREEIKANVVCDNEEKAELNERLQDLKKYLYSKYKIDKEKRQSKPRGANTLSENFKKLRAFFNWAQSEGVIRVSPFSKFKCEKELYGTPYYLTKEEMQKILSTDLSSTPEYERQRDVFIFHCCIGCRVGDLLRLKKSDVIDGAIEYIATKTIADNERTVRVPLNATALAIIEKYKDYHETKLLPFISSQKYNDYIKVVLTKCGITRLVTVLDPITRREEKHPINEIGSSHMARRTFIANIYNKVPDPNVIGSMTGHVEGSRAFARYRTIEDDLKKSLVDILG